MTENKTYEMFHDIDLYWNHFLDNKNSTGSERVKFQTFNSQLSISLDIRII